jgi:hypothetical protein
MLVRRLAGWCLIIAFALVLAIATATIGSCETDCGDQGGRGAFLGVMASIPMAVIGAMLVTAGRRDRLADTLRKLSAVGGVLLGLLALGLLLHAADRIAAGVTGTDLHGPMNDLDQARQNELNDGYASGMAGLVVASLGAGGLLPLLAAGGSRVSRAWSRRVLIALLALCVLIAALGLATSIGEPLMLAFTAVGATGATAAAYALRKGSVRHTN